MSAPDAPSGFLRTPPQPPPREDPPFREVGGPETDYRFSLANERTYLAWMRTAFALVAGGVIAAKTLAFHDEAFRWIVAAPPIIAGAALAFESRGRWHRYEQAMRDGAVLPVGRKLGAFAFMLCAYAVCTLTALTLEH
jgi:uncharacterized membrane protein YidH (DUF202 family)